MRVYLNDITIQRTYIFIYECLSYVGTMHSFLFLRIKCIILPIFDLYVFKRTSTLYYYKYTIEYMYIYI